MSQAREDELGATSNQMLMQRLESFFARMPRKVIGTTIEGRLQAAFNIIAGLRAECDEELLTAPVAVSFVPRRLPEFFRDLRKAVAVATRRGAFLNVWEVAGLNRNELRNAAVLAWLFDSRGSHGRGASVLNAFFFKLKQACFVEFPLPHPVEDYTVATELCPLGDQTSRVDIVIDGRNFSAYVEVKIDAPEGLDQIARYVQVAAERASTTGRAMHGVVFLSPTRQRAISAPDASVLRATWGELAEIIEAVVRTTPQNSLPDACLLQFARHIRSFKR